MRLPVPSFKPKVKHKDFLVLEIGLEKITFALFQKTQHSVSLVGVSHRKYSSPDEIFDSTLEALDSLATIVQDFPRRGIIGVSGGSLETNTTIVRYTRPRPKSALNREETQDILDQVVKNLDMGEKKIFFSTIAGAKVDGIYVSNPLGLKGEKVELSTFIALRNQNEIELLDRLASEIDLKVDKIIPSGFTAARLLESKEIKNGFIIRVGGEKTEVAILTDGHVNEILPIDVGLKDGEYFSFVWELSFHKIQKDKWPSLIWLYADSEDVDLEKAKTMMENFEWKGLGVDNPPTIEISPQIENFSPSDMGVYSLAKEMEYEVS